MSATDAKQFIERLKTDDQLRGELAKAIRDGAATKVADLGRASDLDFTGPEIVKAYSDMLDQKGLPQDEIDYGDPAQAAYSAEPEASYSQHPAYSPGPDSSPHYAASSAAQYANEASTHYADSPDKNAD